MAITIKELLAADTISQAADKINFNFDQLLLNGGGPVGPPGPFGPPGPIGGRGIRGSQWFDGSLEPNDPSIVFPPLEPNDMYLEGPVTTTQTGDGDVWEFNGTAWIWTGINLKGDKGDPGTSADWDAFGHPMLVADQQVLYPVQETSIATNVRSVEIGGIPDAIWVGAPPDPNYAISDSLAVTMDNALGGASLFIHVPDPTVSAIKFSGGDTVVSNYTTDITQLASIGIIEGDMLVLKDMRQSGDAAYELGIQIDSFSRDIRLRASRGVQIESSANTGPGYTSDGDIVLRVLADVSGGGGPYTNEIVLENLAMSCNAFMKVGTLDSYSLAPSYQGNIIGEAKNIWYSTNGTILLYTTGGSATSIELNATAGGIDVSAQGNIMVDATAGQININAPANNIFIDSGAAIDIIAVTSILLRADDGVGSNIRLISGNTGNVGINTPGVAGSTLSIGGGSGSQANLAVGADISSTLFNPDNSLWVQACGGIGSLTPPNTLYTLTLTTDSTLTTKFGTQLNTATDPHPSFDFIGLDQRITQTVPNSGKRTGFNAQMYTHTSLDHVISYDTSINSPFGLSDNILYQGSNANGNPGVNKGLWLTGNDWNYFGMRRGGIGMDIINPAISPTTDFSGNAESGEWGFYMNEDNVWGTPSSGDFIGHMWFNQHVAGNGGVPSGGAHHYGMHFLTDYHNSGLSSPAQDNYGFKMQQTLDVGGTGGWLGYIMFGGTDAAMGNNFGGISFGTTGTALPTQEVPERMRLTEDGSLFINRGDLTNSGPVPPGYNTHSTSGTIWEGGISQTMKLWVNGWTICTGIQTTSDERLKDDIKPIPSALDIINKLEPITYKWKDEELMGSIPEAGFSAQKTKEILPDAVRLLPSDELEGGMLVIHYESIISYLTKGIQEVSSENDELKTRLKAIEEKLGL